MSQVLDELLALMKLETIEQGIYRGQSQDLGFRALFGGQVMGQALSAAKETVDPSRGVHSFHSYFLRPGDANHPIVYDVENIRDGKSFSTRRVQAIQFGKPIFYLTASFHGEEPGFEHQAEMPQVPGPEGLQSDLEVHREHAELIPESLRSKFTSDKPILMRFVTAYNPFKPEITEAKRYVWIKANGNLPDDQRIHQYLLAYASDFNFYLRHSATRSFLCQPENANWQRSICHVVPPALFRMDDWAFVMPSIRQAL